MSVQNETLDMKAIERKPEAPELEYKSASQDSLSMFLAALGGMVLGTMATLLILALINGGTLNFVHPERLTALEQSLTSVNANLGAVSQNVDAVAAQVQEVRTSLADATAQVDQARAALQSQGNDVAQVQSAMSSLQETGAKFDTLVLGLKSVLNSMESPAAASAPAASAPVADAAALPAPQIAADAKVKPDAVAVFVFVDANGNNVMDGSESALVGPQVAVQDAAGKTIDTYASTDTGVLAQGLAPATYGVVVEDAAGHTLLTAAQAQVTVAADAKEGQAVYFPVAQ